MELWIDNDLRTSVNYLTLSKLLVSVGQEFDIQVTRLFQQGHLY